jgi:hypothetical protein
VPVSLTVLLVVAAVVLLAFGIGSTGGALRFLGGGFALLVAIAATAATIGLVWLGQKNHWTSDGPGMLGVMIALVVCAIVAAAGWISVFGIATSAAAPVNALPDAPPDSKRVLRLLGFALLAIAVLGQGLTAFLGRGRAAHSTPVVAVSFANGGPHLVTVDATGTLVDWDLHSKREGRRRTIPELAGVTELFVDSTVETGFAIANGKAVRFAPFGNAPVETIPDARHIARSGQVVIARGQALLFVSHDDWTRPPYREMAWPEPILAVAARDMFVAVADRASITLLDGRVNSVRTIASVPAPGAIAALEVLYEGTVLAFDGSGAGWAIDLRRRVAEPLAAKASLVAGAAHVFFVREREVSEYDPRKKTAVPVAKIGSGARSIDTWGEHVAFGLDDGEVVLGTHTGGGAGTGAKLETERLTAARPGQ